MATEKGDPKNLPARRPPAQMSSTGARAHLECTGGPEKEQTFRIAPAVTIIGRDPSCDVVLSETAISRQHCRIDRSGEVWVLKNLSSNGTRLKRKPIDEVVLSDGDEIRIGAKTRLEFVIEEVAKLVSGRPQFRARSGDQDEEEAEGEEAETQEEQPSLFKRRRGLFIGLGAYLGVILIIATILGLGGCPTRTHRSGPPRLHLDRMIIPAPGAKPMRIANSTPEGIIVENELGELLLVPHEDLRSGKAKRVPGIRQAIDVQYYERHVFKQKVQAGEIPPNYPYVIEKKKRGLAEQYKKEAIEQYLVADRPGKEAALLASVRLFQKALAHYGMTFLPDPNENKVRIQATKRLIEDKVYTLYTRAIVFEKAGDYERAWGTYKLILRYVPEEQNPIFRNVSARMSALRKVARKNR